jgi:hypothetical protein
MNPGGTLGASLEGTRKWAEGVSNWVLRGATDDSNPPNIDDNTKIAADAEVGAADSTTSAGQLLSPPEEQKQKAMVLSRADVNKLLELPTSVTEGNPFSIEVSKHAYWPSLTLRSRGSMLGKVHFSNSDDEWTVLSAQEGTHQPPNVDEVKAFVGGLAQSPSTEVVARVLQRAFGDGRLLLAPGDTIPGTHFVIGGNNGEQAIDSLRKWRHYDRMSEGLRPQFRPDKLSEFLGTNEDLVDVLKKDHFALQSMGYTHGQLAKKIEDVLKEEGAPVLDPNALALGATKYIDYNGQTLRVTTSPIGGYLYPPLPGVTSPDSDISITNLKNQAAIRLRSLSLLKEYGFLEGESSPFRVNPKALVRVLDGLE